MLGNVLRFSRHALAVLGTLSMLLGLALCAAPSAASADTLVPFIPPLPTVSESIPVTAESFPFQGAGVAGEAGLPLDYTEEEYLLFGNANVYDWAYPTGVSLALQDQPYGTRILIRRPADPKDFSGRLQLEMFNPSSGLDIPIVWAELGDYFTRSGDIWVGLTCQPSPIRTLWFFNGPVNSSGGGGGNGRYDDLFSDDAGEPIFSEQGQGWDIIAQTGRLLKTDSEANPLFTAGFEVERMYLMGQSQTAMYTLTYINGFSMLERMPDGSPIYDGYFPLQSFGATRINELGHGIYSDLPFTDPRRNVVPGHDAPVIHVQTETEVAMDPTPTRADSNDPLDCYRLYEVPGASHADDAVYHDLGMTPGEGVFYTGLLQLRGTNCTTLQLGGRTADNFPVPIPWALYGWAPSYVAPNAYPLRYVEAAALENLDRWVKYGIPAPVADRVARPVLTTRDANGNAIGGVRTPYLNVPTGSYAAGNPSYLMNGFKVPFTETQLRALYKNHGGYVNQVVRDCNKLVNGRWLLLEDATEIKTEAAMSNVPFSAPLP